MLVLTLISHPEWDPGLCRSRRLNTNNTSGKSWQAASGGGDGGGVGAGCIIRNLNLRLEMAARGAGAEMAAVLAAV